MLAMTEIDEIINILKDSDIYEFHWEKEDRKIFLSRASIDKTSGMASLNINSSTETKQENFNIQKISAQHEKKVTQIKAPMVGTFYNGTIGGNKSFVMIGTKIKKGQIVCIIEAMKVIKEIPSELEGEILDIYVENGQPVEYGQLLFTITHE